MGVRVSGILSEKTVSGYDRSLTYAGDFLGLTADEYIGLYVLTATLGIVFGGIATVIDNRCMPAIFVLGLLFGAVPHLVVDNARVQRFRALNRGLPYAIDLMSLSMSAGLDFPGSVHQVVTRAKA